jgi:hypothetical protein
MEKFKTITPSKRNQLGYMIKMKDAPVVKHPDTRIPSHYGVWIIIVGTTGCGKTFLLREIVPMFKRPTYVVIATLLPSEAHQGIEDYFNEIGGTKVIRITTPNEWYEQIALIKMEIVQDKTRKSDCLLIFDDFFGSKKRNQYNAIQIDAFSQLRNFNFNGISISQSYKNYDTSQRNNASIKIMFPCRCRWSEAIFRDEIMNYFRTTTKEEKDNLSRIIQRCLDYINEHSSEHRFLCLWSDPIKLTLDFEKTLLPQDDIHAKSQGEIDKMKREESESEGEESESEEEESESEEEESESEEEESESEEEERSFGSVHYHKDKSNGMTSRGKGIVSPLKGTHPKDRHLLISQAVDMGLPPNKVRFLTNYQLQKYIDHKVSLGEKEAGNTGAPDISLDANIQRILDRPVHRAKTTLMSYLRKHVKQHQKGDKHAGSMLLRIADEIVKDGHMTKDQMIEWLQNHGVEVDPK